MADDARTIIAPQAGAQTRFLSSSADFVVYGGAAGGGKSYALILEGLRHKDNPKFRAIAFRRTSPQLTAAGGLWDKASQIYPLVGGVAREKFLEYRFPSNATMRMSHLEHDGDVENHQGAEYPLILFDELTHFTRKQFFYMVSRNRSDSGVRPYIRASTNPDPKSFVLHDFVTWYLDDEGFPHPDKCGVHRYFVRDDEQVIWGATREEVREQVPHLFADDRLRLEDLVLSFTFIPSKLDDNPALEAKDPSYRAKLNALSLVDRARLRDGNWFIEPTGGNVFREEWFDIVDDYPRDAAVCRYWDLAGTKRRSSDSTAGVLAAFKDGVLYLVDVKNNEGRPLETERIIRHAAEMDGRNTPIYVEQENGAAAFFAIDNLQRKVLAGWAVEGVPVRGTGGKLARANPLSSAAEAGNVKLVRGEWNRAFLRQAQAFPEGAHDDMIDAASGAHFALTGGAPDFAYASA